MLRRAVSLFTLAALLLVAGLPLYGLLLPGATESVEGEKRVYAPFPADASLEEFPAEFEAYFQDHFAFRGALVRAYNDMSFALRGHTDRVVYGSDGWMYYMLDQSRQDILHLDPYTTGELEEICRAQQETADALAEQGIVYHLLICPDKHSIYPEYLPASLQVKGGESRLEAMLRALAERTNVSVIDVRREELAAKEEHQLYQKTDSHWNAYGAFIAYDALAQLLEEELPGFRRLREGDFNYVESPDLPGGDLAEMVGLSEQLPEGLVNSEVPDSAVVVEAGTPEEIVTYVNPANPDGPRGLLFRDSFSMQMIPLLREGFSRLTVVPAVGVLKEYVQSERPDVVIMEYVERLSPMAAYGMIHDGEAKLEDWL